MDEWIGEYMYGESMDICEGRWVTGWLDDGQTHRSVDHQWIHLITSKAEAS